MSTNCFLHFAVCLVHRFTILNKTHDTRPPSLCEVTALLFGGTHWPNHFSLCFKSKLKTTITRAPALHFPPSSSYRPTTNWLIDRSANQDASTTFYPEARRGTRLCSIHTDATMLPPPFPPSPPPLSAHPPITHSPPRSTPTQAWALDRITSVSTNPSVSRQNIHSWWSQWGGIMRASLLWCISCWNWIFNQRFL